VDDIVCCVVLEPPGRQLGCGPRHRSGDTEEEMNISTLEEKDVGIHIQIDTILKVPRVFVRANPRRDPIR